MFLPVLLVMHDFSSFLLSLWLPTEDACCALWILQLCPIFSQFIFHSNFFGPRDERFSFRFIFYESYQIYHHILSDQELSVQ